MDNVKTLDKVFNEDISEWFDKRLVEYLDSNFDKWLVNPLDNLSYEIFVSVDEVPFDLDLDEIMFDNAMYLALDLLNFAKVEDESGYLTELLPDYALNAFYFYSISELGDEPFDNDSKLKYSSNLL